MTNPNSEKTEEDVQADPNVAGSRAARDEDGDYVGRTFADDDFDSGESGAERRSRDG